MKCVQFNLEEERIKDFIKLPLNLYSKTDNMEDKNEINKLLKGTHTLSKYFKLDKFLIYDDSDNVVGRFCITTYPDDKTAYLGFFECINDNEVSKYLFDNAYKFCKKKKYKSIVGPVDASFWIKYRLKINKFDLIPYTGEPYNKDYYFNMFLDNNYEVIEHYTSNIYKEADADYSNFKFSNRYMEFINNGYKIISPDMSDFDNIIKDVYYLLINLYKDFPIFKSLDLEDFLEIFKSYKSILNPTMVKLAYYDEKMVGFFIGLPNYNNLVYHTNNLSNILKILKLKNKPKQYIYLYMGADPRHKGLGKALVESIMNELRDNYVPNIGALMRDGKVTQNYVEDLIDDKYEYVLLERKIK